MTRTAAKAALTIAASLAATLLAQPAHAAPGDPVIDPAARLTARHCARDGRTVARVVLDNHRSTLPTTYEVATGARGLHLRYVTVPAGVRERVTVAARPGHRQHVTVATYDAVILDRKFTGHRYCGTSAHLRRDRHARHVFHLALTNRARHARRFVVATDQRGSAGPVATYVRVTPRHRQTLTIVAARAVRVHVTVAGHRLLNRVAYARR